jgi:hypothetical protein
MRSHRFSTIAGLSAGLFMASAGRLHCRCQPLERQSIEFGEPGVSEPSKALGGGRIVRACDRANPRNRPRSIASGCDRVDFAAVVSPARVWMNAG